MLITVTIPLVEIELPENICLNDLVKAGLSRWDRFMTSAVAADSVAVFTFHQMWPGRRNEIARHMARVAQEYHDDLLDGLACVRAHLAKSG